MKDTSEGFLAQNVPSSSKKLALGLGICVLGAIAVLALAGEPASPTAGAAFTSWSAPDSINFLQYFSGKQAYIDAMWSAFAAGDSAASTASNYGRTWGATVNAGFTTAFCSRGSFEGFSGK
jgi:hypothetical protein